MSSKTFDCDCLVIGAGAGGLAAAALLARAGQRVTVLEAHSTSGGCAGWFDRYQKVPGVPPERFRFDVGATTVSGVEPGQPLARLFDALGRWPELHRVDPGMTVHLDDGTEVVRWSDRERWIAECERVFGSEGQRRFWEQVHQIADRGWGLSRSNPTFPPHSFGDLLGLVRPGNIIHLPLLAALRRTVAAEMASAGLDRNERFRRFLDEQLMITAQNSSAHVPLIVGAMGLDYPASTWYVDGGMSGTMLLLEQVLAEHGGEIRFKRRATSIARHSGRWQINTARGERYFAESVIANLTLPNLTELLEEGRFIGEERGGDGKLLEGDRAEGDGPGREAESTIANWWGAFTLYGAVADSIDDRGTLYHQLHLDHREGWEGADSIFLSLSRRGDTLRAPAGWRTFSVSTHLPQPWRWLNRDGATGRYRERKERMERSILNLLGQRLSGFADAEKRWLLSGTPRTFLHYTGRIAGSVGGVPHDVRTPLWRMPNYRTRHPGLYIVGDTVYPGQGLPGVTLGALNLVRELTSSSCQ